MPHSGRLALLHIATLLRVDPSGVLSDPHIGPPLLSFPLLPQVLRSGKGHLKMRDSVTAKTEFENALRLARSGDNVLESPWKAERKALRGLGAANQQLKDYPKALDAMMEVLKISEKMDDQSGVADAIGVIADIYTDKGDVREIVPLVPSGPREVKGVCLGPATD